MVKLTQEEIIVFIEQYGDGDVYFSHYYNNGVLEIKYFPALAKFADTESFKNGLKDFKKEISENPHLKDRYLKEIVLTDKQALIPNDEKSNERSLVKNYKKFLNDLSDFKKKEKQNKYAKKSDFCKQENVKANQKKYKRNNHKSGGRVR